MANRLQLLYRSVLVGILCLTPYAALLAGPDTVSNPADAQKPPHGPFIRVQRDAKGQPVALQTAVVRYTSGEGNLVVDLIGAVHVGDRSYYQKLNQQMEQYDVLLYELVAPPGTRIPRGGRPSSDNPIAMLQQLGKMVLGLEAQTEQIDYTKKNFVHADMSPQQLTETMHNRGETGLTLFLSIAADLLKQQNLQELKKQKTPAKQDDDLDLFSLLLDPDASVKLKRALAQQMADFLDSDAALGRTLNTILIKDRNQAALKVFQAQLAKGKKKIGIFYGVGHLADFGGHRGRHAHETWHHHGPWSRTRLCRPANEGGDHRADGRRGASDGSVDGPRDDRFLSAAPALAHLRLRLRLQPNLLESLRQASGDLGNLDPHCRSKRRVSAFFGRQLCAGER